MATIDRRALVARYHITRTACDPWVPVQVGNGQFAFGADITGLQSLVPFGCLSSWGWHERPVPCGVALSAYRGRPWFMHGRDVYLPDRDPAAPQVTRWLTENPSRLNLGRLGLLIDGRPLVEAEVSDCRQVLDLWSGTLSSYFHYQAAPVHVVTCCHPAQDTVAVRILSPLTSAGRLAVFVDFPYGDAREFAAYVGDWAVPRRHHTEPLHESGRTMQLRRTVDATTYHVTLGWEQAAVVEAPRRRNTARPLRVLQAKYGEHDVTARLREQLRDDTLVVIADRRLAPATRPAALSIEYLLGDETGRAIVAAGGECRLGDDAHWHRYVLRPTGRHDRFELTCTFSPDDSIAPASPAATLDASATHWPEFWTSGGAIDLSGSHDARAAELERRIVLSQYLMAVNEASAWPPQESGLVNNGWHGKLHLEMYLWHAAQWALWRRWPLLRRSLEVYQRWLPAARQRAAAQGFRGARWPKCTGPCGRESPHEIHALLVWQQPHVFFFAELDYRAHPSDGTLRWWQPILEETADFLASYVSWEEVSQRYVLGPPLHIVSENTDPTRTRNPAFELSYWRFGLTIAQRWRERLGLARRPHWDLVLQRLAPLPEEDGCYITHEGLANMWTAMTFEHPAIAGIYGLLPGPGVRVETMRRTAARLFETWQFERIWGWDFPMLAMCAARLGQPERAVDVLLHASSRFQFTDAGLATGGPFPYFPSNGGLLYAVAMMSAGWPDCEARHAPGFPAAGWTVHWENLSPAL